METFYRFVLTSFTEFLCKNFDTSPPWRRFSCSSRRFRHREASDLVLVWAESADAPIHTHTHTQIIFALHRSLINKPVSVTSADVSRGTSWQQICAKGRELSCVVHIKTPKQNRNKIKYTAIWNLFRIWGNKPRAFLHHVYIHMVGY